MNSTPRLGLPFLSAGQANKEIVHNEGLQMLDALVAGAVEDVPLPTPPAAPVAGACYIVGPDATDAWAGNENKLAAFTDAGWRFISPAEGFAVYARATGVWAVFRAGAWEMGSVRGTALMLGGEQVVGSRLAAIPSPAGGATIDNEARTALDQILGAMRQHGLIDP